MNLIRTHAMLIKPSAAALALSLASLTAGAWEPAPQPEFRNRVGVSFSLGFNASANFSRLAPVLLPPPPPQIHLLDRRYDDGFVLVDAYADGANSIYWGYYNNAANNNLNVAAEQLTLHKTSIDTPAQVNNVGDEPRPGFELTFERDWKPVLGGRFGFEGGFGFLRLTIRDSRTVFAQGTLTSDTYSLADSAVDFFQGSFPNNYSGTFGPAINVPFIPDIPIAGTRTTEPVTLTIAGTREFEANVYFWRLGGYWERELTDKLNFILDGGATLVWIHSKFMYYETTQLPFGGPVVDSGEFNKRGWQVGGYVGANLTYELTKRISLRTGARFEMVGDYHQRTGGREATFNLGKSVFFTFGATYAF